MGKIVSFKSTPYVSNSQEDSSIAEMLSDIFLYLRQSGHIKNIEFLVKRFANSETNHLDIEECQKQITDYIFFHFVAIEFSHHYLQQKSIQTMGELLNELSLHAYLHDLTINSFSIELIDEEKK